MMRAMWRRWLLVPMLALAGAAAPSAPGVAQADNSSLPPLPAPPLFPGEMLVRTGSGCGQILGPDFPRYMIEEVQARIYHGKCERGLLQGRQEYTRYMDTEGKITFHLTEDFLLGREVSLYSETGEIAVRYTLSGSVFQLRDSKAILEGRRPLDSPIGWDIRKADHYIGFNIRMILCSAFPKIFHECDPKTSHPEKFDVPALYMADKHFPAQKGDFEISKPCSNRVKLESCLTGSVVARAKAWLPELEAATEEADAWPDRIAALNATYVAAYDAALAERDRALAARAAAERQRIAAEQAAAAARTQRAAEENAAFEASLTTLGAGQLFAKADELQGAGEADKARRMLRALVSRFPNSPLAETAAQQLSGFSGGSSAGSGAVASRGTGSGGGSSGLDCEGILKTYMDKINPPHFEGIPSDKYNAYTVWLQIKVGDAARQIGCPASVIQRVQASVEKMRGMCRDFNARGYSNDCQNGVDARPAGYAAREVGALQDAIADARRAGGGSMASGGMTGSGVLAGGNASVCKAKLAEYQDRMHHYNVHVGPDGRSVSSILSFQYAMYFTQHSVQLLDTYCRGQPDYNDRAGIQRAYDTALRGCEQLSSTNACPGPVEPPLQ